MQDKSWGIRKENVLFLPAFQISDIKAFETEMKKNPEILDITYSAFLPDAEQMTTWRLPFEGVEVNFAVWSVHHNYLRFFGINLAKLISIFSLITVIVTIMGVYGLILFNVKSKRKTIAIHKINGASVKDIIIMLNRGFITQFSIAYSIAVVFAYIIVNRWLENFAYKTPMHWWIFVSVGILVFTA
jgi:hypothetical protein